MRQVGPILPRRASSSRGLTVLLARSCRKAFILLLPTSSYIFVVTPFSTSATSQDLSSARASNFVVQVQRKGNQRTLLQPRFRCSLRCRVVLCHIFVKLTHLASGLKRDSRESRI
ncbi:unnamed protein product [Amoebophrya sp. A25]|nr:unnamed protein product [Amoebophrya sp. A25]|eukprot:GSA25T00015588001.1